MTTVSRRTLSTRAAAAGAAGLLAAVRPLTSFAQAEANLNSGLGKAVSVLDPREAIAAIAAADGTLRFDMAEDATRFVCAAQPAFEDGMPAYGNPFITQGYIYPEDTLGESNGVAEDGSPEFADDLLGEWTCRGWMVGDGMRTKTGPMVITTQL